MEQFYIPLKISETPHLAGNITKKSFSSKNSFLSHETLFEKNIDTSSKDQICSYDGIFELTKKEYQFVLLGELGSGKTTCLRRYLLENIINYKSGDKVFIYLSLSQHQFNQNLMDLICYVSGFSKNNIILLLGMQRIVLLLDSLNECNHQEEWSRQIQLFINDWPKVQIVLTTQPQSWFKNINLKAFALQPLVYKQQISILKFYLKSNELAYVILEQLYNHPGGDIIAKSPLLLSMIAKSIPDGMDGDGMDGDADMSDGGFDFDIGF